jgi:DNA-binding MarR family transcriptional regulator
MPRRLEDEIRQTRPFLCPAEEAFLNLQRTAGVLMRDFQALLRRHAPGNLRLSPSQYNVLRILRGVHPEAIPCGDVGDRLVTPGPDVTRLLDRLEQHGLTERHRDTDDRRVVKARITAAGLELLATLDEPFAEWLKNRMGHLQDEDHQQLSRLLEAARQPGE